MHFRTVAKKYLEHRQNARRSRSEIQRRQLEKFRALIRYAVAHSPYYRDIVSERRIDVDDCRPAEFPVIDKSTLIEQFDRIVTDRSITADAVCRFLESSPDSFELFDDRYYVVHTSGTSGARGYVAYSRQDWSRGITQALRVNPPHFGRRRLAYFACTRGHHVGVTFATCTKRWPMSLVYRTAVFDLEDALAGIVEGLNRFQPTMLMGYPSALAALAREQERGTLAVRPRWIQCSGEPLSRGDRDLIASAFGVGPINVYSCTEHMLLGIARPEYDGMYLLEDDLIFEIKDDYTLVTNLFNYTTPLIRYRLDDVLEPQVDTAKLLPFTKVAEMVERADLVASLTNRHGVDDILHASQMAEIFDETISGFQLRVRDKTSCIVSLCLRPQPDGTRRAQALHRAEAEIIGLLARKDMDNVRVAVEEISEMPRDPRSGKVRFVVHESVMSGVAQ